MSSEILEELFHSKAKVKLLRLFLNNPEDSYLVSEIADKTKVDLSSVKKEIKSLHGIKFLVAKKKPKKIYYCVNSNFIFFNELKKIIFKASPTSFEKILFRVMGLGQIRFVLISGALINSEKGRVDILIVGEHINKARLKNFLANTEAEIGRNINYVCMSADEFRYRKSMFDKFIIDILEGPGKVLIDKLKIDL